MSEIISLHSSRAADEAEDYLLVKFYNMLVPKEKEEDPSDDDVQNKNKSRYATSSLTQFRWLIWRNFVDTFKNPFEIRLRIGLAIVSIIYPSMFSHSLIGYLVSRCTDRFTLSSFTVRSNSYTKFQFLDFLDYHQHII